MVAGGGAGGTTGHAAAGASGLGTARGTGEPFVAQYMCQGGWSPGGTLAGTPAGGSGLPSRPARSRPLSATWLAPVGRAARLGAVVPDQPGQYYRPPLSNGRIGRSSPPTINNLLPHLAWLLTPSPKKQDTIVEPPRTPNPSDLLPQPPKSLVLWRIEGEDPDLHLHRSNLHFPLILLRALLLVFLFVSLVDCC